MIPALVILFVLHLLGKRGGLLDNAVDPVAQRAAQAQQAAADAAAIAAKTQHPHDIRHAAQTAKTAAVLTDHAADQKAAEAAHAANRPLPWPQSVPAGLPAWPSGWRPAQPPTSGQVARAWQLLPALWAKGAGAVKTESTDGKWTTYLASPMGNGTRGVTAWVPKARADA